MMPLRVTDQDHGAQHPGLCWARHHSGGFEWDLSPAAMAAGSTAGADELCKGSAPAPLPCRPYITLELLEHPPQRHVRIKLDPRKLSGEPLFHFEWIAFGLTEKCFWTAWRRWIVALESPVRLTVETLPDSIEST